MNTLTRRYKVYRPGGDVNAAMGLGAGAALVGQLSDALIPGDRYGRKPLAGSILSNAGSLAATGAAFGPLGAAAGAVIGTGLGIVENSKQRRMERMLAEQERTGTLRRYRQEAASAIGADPSLIHGNLSASYYATGGRIKPKDPPPENTLLKKPEFTPLAESTYHHDQIERLLGYTLQGEYAVGGKLGLNSTNLSLQDTEGGKATPLSLSDAYFSGPSHSQGGIDLPNKKAEVEGGETSSGDYIFSARLGFAQAHKPIAKAIGRIEKKPQTPERVASLSLLRGQEERLKATQEYVKDKLGLQ